MSDSNSPNPSQSDDGKDPSGAPDGDKNKPEMISRAEADAAFRARDTERDKRKKLQTDFDSYRTDTETQLGELRAKLSEIETGKVAAEEESAKSAGDIERLQKSWDGQKSDYEKRLDAAKSAHAKEVGELKNAFDGLGKKYHQNLVERALRDALDEVSTKPKAALVFMQKDYKFEAVENDEGLVIGIKPTDSDKSIAEIHKEICEKYDLPFEKNDRANGSGAQPVNGSDGANGTVKLPANFDKKSKEDQTKWFRANPNYRPG